MQHRNHVSRRQVLKGSVAFAMLASVPSQGFTRMLAHKETHDTYGTHIADPPQKPPGRQSISIPQPATWNANAATVAWIGQSTMLINCYGKWILTDPIFSHTLGINVFGLSLGIPRSTPPAIALDALPKPDLILLSHAHIDHTDLPTLERLTRRYPHELIAITAKNTTDVLDKLPWNNVVELDWGHDIEHQGINIRSLETKHNGSRMPWERDRYDGYRKTGRSYNGYRIAADGFTAVFGGDTAYTPAFKELAAEGGADVAMMPIGAYKDYEHLHCTPEQSLQMADEMGATVFVPMHFSTFVQSVEPASEPLTRLLYAAPRFATRVSKTRRGQPLTIHDTHEALPAIAHKATQP